MRTLRLLPALVLCLLLAACGKPSADGEAAASASSGVSASSARSVASAASSAYSAHPVSLEALAAAGFDGSDFRQEKTLESNAAYVKHAVSWRGSGLRITGVLTVPKGEGAFPVIVLAHGYIDPAVYTSGRGLKREQDALTRKGFAVLHVDYRNHAGSDADPDNDLKLRLGYAQDVINGVEALRAAKLPHVDASRAGILGHSMGGGVALNALVVRPDLFKAAVLYAPVSADARLNVDRWIRPRPELSLRIEEAYGKAEDNPAFWDGVSAKAHLDAIRAPVLIHHGTADASVPVLWSQELEKWLKDAGKDVTLRLYPDEGHEFAAAWPLFLDRTDAFFRGHVAGQAAAPASAPAAEEWKAPVSRAGERVTKKPFGLRVAPGLSPVDPERFTGWHVGLDLELLPGETEDGVAVSAACGGEVLYRNWVKGYGGVLVQRCRAGGEDVTVLYGHVLLTDGAPALGARLEPGQAFAVLGKGFSEQTDGERPHLHFSVHRGRALELRGYAEDTARMAGWMDPAGMLP